MYVGTTEQLINALNHMADKRPITVAEREIVREAADRLRKDLDALQSIANPVAAMQKEADAAGDKLDGLMAVTIAKDPHYLREIARKAIE